ncbi:hypothetical protein NE281_07410 [Leuconostoc mesenteroides]|nr:hypothetical protein [Leuconostoc mesenteroides]
MERANIVPLNGKFYLFTDTRLSKSVVQDNVKRVSGKQPGG